VSERVNEQASKQASRQVGKGVGIRKVWQLCGRGSDI